MSYVGAKDFFFEVSVGNIPGHEGVIVQGHNDDIDTTIEDVWDVGGSLTHLTAASTIRIAAGGNAADTAAGTGAQAVYVWGLDANYAPTNSTIVTAGASASSATTEQYLRVLGAKSTVVGSGGVNAGNITIEATTGPTTQARIVAGVGLAHGAFYTVPAGKEAVFMGGQFSTVKGSGGGGAGSGTAGINAFAYTRLYNESSNNNYESWTALGRTKVVEAGGNPADLPFKVGDILPAKTDFRIAAISDTTNMSASARAFLVIRNAS